MTASMTAQLHDPSNTERAITLLLLRAPNQATAHRWARAAARACGMAVADVYPTTAPNTSAREDEENSMPQMDVLDQPEIGRRIRAARGYAALSQPELAELLQVSEGYIRQREGGGKTLRPVEARGLVERIAEICDLPVGFFIADFRQLEPAYKAPEDQLAMLDSTMREMMVRLERLADQADRQLKDGSERLARFGRIIEDSVLSASS